MESVDELQSVITAVAMTEGEDAAIELFDHWLFQSEPVKKQPGKGEKMTETRYAMTVICDAIDRLTSAVKRVAEAFEYGNHQAHTDSGWAAECPICTEVGRNG